MRARGRPIAAVVLFVIFVAPWLIALLLGAMELTFILLACAVALAVHTLLRRPWRVVAYNESTNYRWDVVGWRKSRALLRELERGIAAGRAPPDIAYDTFRA